MTTIIIINEEVIRVTKGNLTGQLGLLIGPGMFDGYECSVMPVGGIRSSKLVNLVLCEGEFERITEESLGPPIVDEIRRMVDRIGVNYLKVDV